MRRIVVGIGIVAVLAAGGAYWLTQLRDTPAPGPSTPSSSAAATTGSNAGVAMPDGLLPETVIGAPNAPVTIVEYASLTCPHCAVFHRETLPELKKNYIDTGQVRLIYRDFPLDSLAMGAAMIARCLGPERYFGFIDMLFRGQATWAGSPNPREELEKTARLVNMSAEAFDGCLQNASILQGIQTRAQEAQQKYQVSSTPTFFIDGRKLSGAIPYDEMKGILDAALKK